MSCPKPLLKAVSAGRTRQVRLLLDLGSSIDEQDGCGQSPLIKAIYLENDRQRNRILKLLLKRDAQVSVADAVGRNALMWACLLGRDVEVKLLIEYCDVDLDFNKADVNGQTALFHAVTSGNAAAVKLMVESLMKYGLSTDTADIHGATPLMQAQRLGHDVCESILVYEGHAKVGLPDNNSCVKREKWAVSSLRDRAKAKTVRQRMNKSEFPPIINVRNQFWNNYRIRDFENAIDSNGETSSSDDENIASILAKPKTLHVGLYKEVCNLPPCIASPKVQLVETSTSEDDSEVDSEASTIIDSKHVKAPQGTLNLKSLYNMKETQMTSSYKKTAVPIIEPPRKLETDGIPDIKVKGNRMFILMKDGINLIASFLSRNSL